MSITAVSIAEQLRHGSDRLRPHDVRVIQYRLLNAFPVFTVEEKIRQETALYL